MQILSVLHRIWNMIQGKEPAADKGKREHFPVLFTGFLKASNPTIIKSDHEFRDPVTGFLDSPPALRQLITHLRENNSRDFDPSPTIFTGKRSFIIGLDAQNLGSMNEVLGRDRADRIWSSYMSEFTNTLSKKLGKINTLTGFRYGGDELVVVVSTDGQKESDIKEALEKTQSELANKFSDIGLNNLPSINPERPAGFGLHSSYHEIWNDKMFVKEIGSYREAIAGLDNNRHNGTKSAHYHGPAVKLDTLSASLELWSVIDNLSKNKPQKNGDDKGISADEFRVRYLDKIDEYLNAHTNPEPPLFMWPENLEMTTSMEGSQIEKNQNHRDFVAQARPNNVLLRFDLSGLKLLNQHLSHVEVEGILERLHETVEHFFMIGSSTYGDTHTYASFDNGSGVIDIMMDADVWKKQKEEGLKYINNFLINTLNFHLLKSYSKHSIGNKNLGESYQEEQARLLEKCDDKNVKQLFAQIEAQFNFAEVLVIEGDPITTLENAGKALEEVKTKNKMPLRGSADGAKQAMHYQI